MLKLVMTGVLIISNFACLISKQTIQKPPETIIEIDLQDFFEKDKITLRLNECLIIKDSFISSSKSDGFTGLSFKVYSMGGLNKVVVRFSNREIKCNIDFHKINVEITLNNSLNKFPIELSKGKYIGFSKKAVNELYFKQSIAPFLYD